MSLLCLGFQYQTLSHLACRELKSFFFFRYQMADAALIAAEHPGEISIHYSIFYRYRIIYKNEVKNQKKTLCLFKENKCCIVFVTASSGHNWCILICLKMLLHKLSKILLAVYWWSKLKHATFYNLFLPLVGLSTSSCFRTKQE